MPVPSKVQLTGSFQDSEGNPLALGYMILTLSSDAMVNNSQVCAGTKIRITLDIDGNVVASQYIWKNSDLQPDDTSYTVAVYSAIGQLVWGPKAVIVTSGNVNSW